MKKEWILLVGIFAFVACNGTAKKEQAPSGKENQTETKVVGGEKDDHGCLVAAGETWSELKQMCLRLFEQGERLNPITTEGSAVISAFVVVDKEQSKFELFLPNSEHTSVILVKKGEDRYENGIYAYDAKKGILYINGEQKFTREK